MIKKIKVYLFLIGTSLPLLPFTALAASEEAESGIISFLTPILEYLILVLLIIGLIIIHKVIKKFGASIMGNLFGYFTIGTIFLIEMRLFIHLVELNILSVANGALHFWWHVMFYLAMLSFFFGLKGLVDLADGKEDKIAKKVSKWRLTLVISTLVIIFVSITTGNSLASFYDGPLFQNSGLHHFIAFAIASLVVYYLIQSKKKIGMIGAGIATPFIISISFWGLQHFWELLTESWKILQIDEEIIEHVEQYLVIIAVLALIYSFVQLKKVTVGNTN